MSKVRTTISLDEHNHRWLKARAGTTGELSEYLDDLVQRERTLGCIVKRLEVAVNQMLMLWQEAQTLQNETCPEPPFIKLHVLDTDTVAVSLAGEIEPSVGNELVYEHDCPASGQQKRR
jgi:hypothetical protein